MKDFMRKSLFQFPKTLRGQIALPPLPHKEFIVGVDLCGTVGIASKEQVLLFSGFKPLNQ